MVAVIQVFTREADLTPTAQAQIYKGSYGLERTNWLFNQRVGKVGFVADYSTFDIQGYRNNSQAKREQLNSVATVDLSADTRLKLIANVFRMPFAKDPLGLTAAQFLASPKQAGLELSARHAFNSNWRWVRRPLWTSTSSLEFATCN